MALTEEKSPADLRALRARTQEPVYLLAARLRVHPGRLSMYLRATLPMPAGLVGVGHQCFYCGSRIKMEPAWTWLGSTGQITAWSWVPARLWTCPRCATTALVRELRCPRCGAREDA